MFPIRLDKRFREPVTKILQENIPDRKKQPKIEPETKLKHHWCVWAVDLSLQTALTICTYVGVTAGWQGALRERPSECMLKPLTHQVIALMKCPWAWLNLYIWASEPDLWPPCRVQKKKKKRERSINYSRSQLHVMYIVSDMHMHIMVVIIW